MTDFSDNPPVYDETEAALAQPADAVEDDADASAVEANDEREDAAEAADDEADEYNPQGDPDALNDEGGASDDVVAAVHPTQVEANQPQE